MKKAKLTLIFILFAFACNSQSLDCARFKQGVFFYPQIPDYGYSIRENGIQKSYIKAKDMWVNWTVKWTDNCNFELIFKDANKKDSTYNLGDRIAVSIISIEEDCYKFTSIFYSKKNPDGKKMPIGEMCVKKIR